jgi:hypothetical protein
MPAILDFRIFPIPKTETSHGLSVRDVSHQLPTYPARSNTPRLREAALSPLTDKHPNSLEKNDLLSAATLVASRGTPNLIGKAPERDVFSFHVESEKRLSINSLFDRSKHWALSSETIPILATMRRLQFDHRPDNHVSAAY